MASILIIDDDPAVLAAMRRVLRTKGHEVLDAPDGRQALALARHHDLDLVITDINMPEMDGIEVITTLAADHPGLPVIAVSGGGALPADELLADAGLFGAVTTLAKPFELAELVGAVEAALARDARGGDSTRA